MVRKGGDEIGGRGKTNGGRNERENVCWGSNHGEGMRIWEDVMRDGIRRGDACEMKEAVVKLVRIMRTRRRGTISEGR